MMRSVRTIPSACRSLLANDGSCLGRSRLFMRSSMNPWSRHLSNERISEFKDRLSAGPALHHFTSSPDNLPDILNLNLEEDVYVAKRSSTHPYIDPLLLDGQGRKVYFETYGCQMNVNDTEIAARILRDHNYDIVQDIDQAQIVFLMTCAIREGAEQKIWSRLRHLRHAKRAIGISQIGLLGCMAERLKTRALEKEKLLDIIAGPDSYRDLPKLLAINNTTGQNAVNVLLSMDETYADVMPSVVDAKSKTSAYVSIMRGCENMCSYCIVPFTRGRERSRPLDSILKEVDNLQANGVREIILLGQNVNSYRDQNVASESSTSLSKGFRTIYKPKTGGLTFDILLDQVAQVNPEVRIRFTSPHPKDFPDEVLQVINKHPNICKNLHLPAQSGSDQVLHRMRRGYTKQAYMELVSKIRKTVPGVSFTSDFIFGFCGETEADHAETIDLIDNVKYNFLYMFAYSMREKTHAHYHLTDDVPQQVKVARVDEANRLFRKHALEKNQSLIGTRQLVLVEGPSRRSEHDYAGRNDANVRVIFPFHAVDDGNGNPVLPKAGDYLCVSIVSATSQSLRARPLAVSSIGQFNKEKD